MDKTNKFLPLLSRRDFNKLTLGAGAALATGSLFGSGCGSSDTPPPKETFSEVNLHFDLSHMDAKAKHTLRVGGNRYTVAAHTADSLQTAVANETYLAGKQNITHYVSKVLVPDHKPIHFSVTSVEPHLGNCLALIGVHISAADRAEASKGATKASASSVARESCKAVGISVECGLQDQTSDNFYTTFDAASSLVFHHPEIASLNSKVKARVEVLINESAAVGNLAMQICSLGKAHVHTSSSPDGWCILVPLTNSDGTPKLDGNKQQIYDYQFNPLLNDYIRAAVTDVLSRIKNDPTLKGKMYTSYPHGSTDSSGIASKLSKRVQLWKSGGTQLAATETGYKHNVYFKTPTFTGSGSSRSFSIIVDNVNFIWYGVYIQYIDANGNPMNYQSQVDDFITLLQAEYKSLGGSSAGSVNWIDGDTVKLHWIISSPPTLFGVPLPSPVELNVTLIDGAVAARIMLCGPGVYGKVDYGPSLVLGILFTAIFNFGVPMYSLYSGSGLTDTSTLWNIVKQPTVLIKIAAVLLESVRDIITPDSANTLGLLCSIESLLASLVDSLAEVLFKGLVPEITAWLTTVIAGEEVEDSIPFVGWALRIVTVVGTVGDMVAGVAEICTNPVVIDNIITFTNSVDVTVNCDPTDYQFPEESTYYEVQFTVGGCPYPSQPQGFTLDQTTRGKKSFIATVDGVPTTGQNTDSVDIWFYSNSNKGFLAGHGKATFANIGSATDLTATITITENPMSVTATTIYSQHRKLAYSGGKYFWQEGAGLAVPSVEASNCGGAGLCSLGNITVWVPGGMIGYTWQTGNEYMIKNVNASEADPSPGMKLLKSGTASPTPIVYDKTAPSENLNGNHFYLDPVDTSATNPEYQLRKLNLDSSSTTFKSTGSWGCFRIQLDRIAVHPNGYVIGISSNYSKMAVLDLPTQAYANDTVAYNNAVLKLGEGDGDKLIQSPQALTISRSGAILILQGQNAAMSIKAFDVYGNPWPYFANGTSLSFPLASVDADAKWLDIAIDDTELIFILSYTGTGLSQNDYHLDIYDKNGNRIVRNTGIAVARMTVDKFRRLYSLNQETIKGSPIVEPSASVWLPSLP